jgi:hypothetical protein
MQCVMVTQSNHQLVTFGFKGWMGNHVGESRRVERKCHDDASVSAQGSTEPQLSGRRLKRVMGCLGSGMRPGQKRRVYKGRGVQESAEQQARYALRPRERQRSAPQALPPVLRKCRVRVRHLPEIRVSIVIFNNHRCSSTWVVAEQR